MMVPPYVTYARQPLRSGFVAKLYLLLVVVSFVGWISFAVRGRSHLTREVVQGSSVALYAEAVALDAGGAGACEAEAPGFGAGAPCGRPLPRQEPGGPSPVSTCRGADVLEGSHQQGGSVYFLATHVHDKAQRRTCESQWQTVALQDHSPGSGPGCLQRSYFLSNVEDVRFGIEHHLQSRQDSSKAWGVRELHGSLVDGTGKVLVELSSSHRDLVSLRDLLRSAGLSSLDEASDSGRILEPCGEWLQKDPRACCEDFGRSLRARGMYLEVDIEYSNLAGVWFFPHDVPSYTIRARRVPAAEAYRTEAILGCGGFASELPAAACNRSSTCLGCIGEHRVVRLSSGIQVSVRQVGLLGHFRWSELIVWVGGLSFALTFSWQACEFLIEYLPATKGELYANPQRPHAD